MKVRVVFHLFFIHCFFVNGVFGQSNCKGCFFGLATLFAKQPSFKEIQRKEAFDLLARAQSDEEVQGETFKEIGSCYFNQAKQLKEAGDRLSEADKRLFYPEAQITSFQAASSFLTLFDETKRKKTRTKMLHRAEKAMEISAAVELWKLETYGRKNYQVADQMFEIWPRIRKGQKTLSSEG